LAATGWLTSSAQLFTTEALPRSLNDVIREASHSRFAGSRPTDLSRAWEGLARMPLDNTGYGEICRAPGRANGLTVVGYFEKQNPNNQLLCGSMLKVWL